MSADLAKRGWGEVRTLLVTVAYLPLPDPTFTFLKESVELIM